MSLESFYNKFKLDKSLIEKSGFNPYYKTISSALEEEISIDDKKYINLASNNYLGLANDLRIKQASIEAIEKYGVSLCGTPIATGYIELFQKLEKRLSNFVGCEDAIILPSCYQANNGIFSTIVDKNDVVIVDHYAHSSLIEGIRATSCKIRPFLHNNLNSLEKILKKSSGYNKKLVVTESVFSTEGSVAPFDEIIEICKKYDAVPLIDDSHGIGVLGKHGKGILEHFEIKDFQGIYTASLGKAFANSGGIIAGKSSFIEYLKYYNPHFIYSTALPPAVLGGINKTIDVLNDEFEQISKKMWKNYKRINLAIKKSGFSFANGEAPINSIVNDTSLKTIILAKKLFDKGILSTPFIYPSVPLNEGKIRLIAGANLSENSISYVEKTILELGKKI